MRKPTCSSRPGSGQGRKTMDSRVPSDLPTGVEVPRGSQTRGVRRWLRLAPPAIWRAAVLTAGLGLVPATASSQMCNTACNTPPAGTGKVCTFSATGFVCPTAYPTQNSSYYIPAGGASAVCPTTKVLGLVAMATHNAGSGPNQGTQARCTVSFVLLCENALNGGAIATFFMCSVGAPQLPVELMEFSVEGGAESAEGEPEPDAGG